MLTPLIKAWGTDIGIEVASLGIQVHGGMGFVEETGAAQHWRDSRIAPIYEGTNGIQAADLVTRKLALDNGEALTSLIEDIARESADEESLFNLAGDCAAIVKWMREDASLDDKLAGSVPFCTMLAVATAGWQLTRQLKAVEGDAEIAQAKRATVRFFLDRIVPEASGLKASAIAGGDALYDIPTEALLH